jgi:hypothetical protein
MRSWLCRYLNCVLFLGILSSCLVGAEQWQPLFNGNDLIGWKNPYAWGKSWVEEDEIRLQADKKFFLITEEDYGDFIFEGEILMPEGKANSGFMFRCHAEPNRVFGYQAEVDPSSRKWAGGLYDEGRRKWLNPLEGKPEAQSAYKPGEWNKYRIECSGNHLKIYVNDILTTDYLDPVDLTGPIGIQHHGEKGQIYRFRNLRIQDLGNSQWKPLIEGDAFNNFKSVGGNWTIKNGEIHGTSPAAEKKHGLLLSNETFDDFSVRFQFKATKGNSGFYFRSEPKPGGVSIHGFQAEIEDGKTVGGLYETGGRGWVVQPNLSKAKKPYYMTGEWNEMVVIAAGDQVSVFVNGERTAAINDEKGRKSGHFAFQLHGGQDMDVEFKNVEILDSSKNE